MFFHTNLVSLLIWQEVSTRRFQPASKEELHLIYKTMKVDAYNYSNNLNVTNVVVVLVHFYDIFKTFCKLTLCW